MAKKYREKPCNEFEAVQWTGKNISEVRNFTIKTRNGVAEQRSYLSLSSSSLFIMEPDKDVEVSRNDYIIKGVDGEFYVCEQDVFEKVYEEVKEFELANELKKANAKVDALEKRISDMNHNSEIEKVRKIYERLAKGGIECSMTVDDETFVTPYYNGHDIQHYSLTEIPTPHGKLIDADKLVWFIDNHIASGKKWVEFETIKDMINSLPTIIEAEVSE